MRYKQYNIFTGNAGSGKTEIALNFAFMLKEKIKDLTMVDFDIINPYFRTNDIKSELVDKDIKVIAPIFANTNIDVPALPAQINAVFENPTGTAVFDVGGDDLGAKVLSRYRNEIINRPYEHFFVANLMRPETNTEAGILEMINSIEITSGIKITGIINNTNLMESTELKHLIKGEKVLKKVSLIKNIDIVFTVLLEDFVDYSCSIDGEIMVIKKKMKLPWV